MSTLRDIVYVESAARAALAETNPLLSLHPPHRAAQDAHITLRTLSVLELADYCMHEMSNYRHGEPYNDSYCLELFRRAIFERDQHAWEVLQDRLSPIVASWLRRHPRREVACRFDSEENYVAQAFERFWQSTVYNQQVEFSTLAAALRYLHASLNGALLDALRAYSRPKELSLPEPGYPGEPSVEDDDEDREGWEAIQSILIHPLERRLAYLLFHCGLKPREIMQHCPQEFRNVQEIYRVRRNIIEKLQRNIDQIRWRLNSECV